MSSEDRNAFLLRSDSKLWAELESWAGDELRSVNGQIEFLLRQTVQQRRKKRLDGGFPPEPARDR